MSSPIFSQAPIDTFNRPSLSTSSPSQSILESTFIKTNPLLRNAKTRSGQRGEGKLSVASESPVPKTIMLNPERLREAMEGGKKDKIPTKESPCNVLEDIKFITNK